MNKTLPPDGRKNCILCILFTILVSIGFGFAIYNLVYPPGVKHELSAREMQKNEILAYKNLKIIAAAQEKYIQKDWTGDGQKSYALFYIHLWRSISPQGDHVPVNLIPRELGFAMDISSPLSGYYYMDLRHWRLDLKNRQEFNYEKEWALAAAPSIYRHTGFLTLIVNHTGRIYATQQMHSEPEHPIAPQKSGWTEINNLQQLQEFQKKIPYPQQ